MQITTVFVIACILGIASFITAQMFRPGNFYTRVYGPTSSNVRGRVQNVQNVQNAPTSGLHHWSYASQNAQMFRPENFYTRVYGPTSSNVRGRVQNVQNVQNTPTSGLHHWSYASQNGPDRWVIDYPQCGGSIQSPVNIVERTTLRVNLAPITFSGYNDPLSNFQVQNNGHTVVFTLPITSWGRYPRISGGDLPYEYDFNQFHFHWGKNDAIGSEHKINGRSYPMEIHFYHVNKAEMAAGRTGIAVLSAFFEITSYDNPNMDVIVDALRQVRTTDQTMPLRGSIVLSSLIPQQANHFFRYIGSLTTPPCTEGVVWLIFKETLPISRVQLQAFRDLHEFPEINQHKLYDNFRPTQIINGRQILESTNTNPPNFL